MLLVEQVPANSVPAAAVRQKGRASCDITRRCVVLRLRNRQIAEVFLKDQSNEWILRGTPKVKTLAFKFLKQIYGSSGSKTD